jgi:hypothetical protein
MRSISLVVLFILAIVTSVVRICMLPLFYYHTARFWNPTKANSKEFQASDQSCNSGDATTVDTDPSLIGIAVSAALLLEVEAALVAFVKRDFTCESIT